MLAAILSDHYEDTKSSSYFECDRTEMLAYIPQSTRTILEVGCGAGMFGRFVKTQRPVEIWGVEMDSDAAARASTYLDRVLTGAFPNGVALPERYFDCVVFNDVLEHMIDPWNALAAAKNHLTPEGHVVASIPNIRYLPILYRLLIRGEWTYTPTGALDKTHLRFFTKKSMLAMFDEGGFEVIRIEGIYAYKKWQVPILEVLFPHFTREAKYIDYAILARPKDQRVVSHV
jgi:2-polyprenyl-3-methyl-5-hydroxy-6-metoxy-1,4-benzoquinol methylase